MFQDDPNVFWNYAAIKESRTLKKNLLPAPASTTTPNVKPFHSLIRCTLSSELILSKDASVYSAVFASMRGSFRYDSMLLILLYGLEVLIMALLLPFYS